MLPCKVRLMLGGFILNLKRKKKKSSMDCVLCILFSPGLQLVFQSEDSSFSDVDDLANTFSKVICPWKLEFSYLISVFFRGVEGSYSGLFASRNCGKQSLLRQFFFVHRIITLVYCLLYTEAWITNSSKMYHMKFCFTYLETWKLL